MSDKKTQELSTLFNLITNTSNWKDIHNSGKIIDLSWASTSSISDIQSFLKSLQLTPLIFTKQKKEKKHLYLYLNNAHFKVLEDGIQHQNSTQNLYKYNQLYQSLTDKEWEKLSKLTTLYIGENKKSNTIKRYLFKHIKKHATNSPIAWFLINEFLRHYPSDKTHPTDTLSIDVSISGAQTLNQAKANGMASFKKNKGYILLMPALFFDPQIVSVFFHELRHIIQRFHLYPTFKSNDLESGGLYNAIHAMVTEAEALAYELLVLKEKNRPVSEIFQFHKKNAIKKIISTPQKELPFEPNLTAEQKITATLRLIEIETHENTLNTLCKCYLSKSNLDLYLTLKNENIELKSKDFNFLSKLVQNWHNYYLRNILLPMIKENIPQKMPDFNPYILEHLWYLKTGRRLNLNPQALFSYQLTEELSIQHLIYGPNKIPSKPYYKHIYKGINDIPDNIDILLKEKKYFLIKSMYQQLCEKNPLLPKSIQLENKDKQALIYIKAIKKIKQGAPFCSVLETLRYCLDIPFKLIKKDKKLKDIFINTISCHQK